MSFFCTHCGSLLDNNECINPNCISVQKKGIKPKEQGISTLKYSGSPTQKYQITPSIVSSYHLEPEIPCEEGSFRVLCCSDWRVQSIPLLLNFVKCLTPPADVILYAGDDIERFLVFKSQEVQQNIYGNDSITMINPKDLTHNYFEELARHTSHGLLAVIGNDCHPRANMFIRGKNVVNLNNNLEFLDNFVFLGLPGAESITSDVSRSIEAGTHPRDVGPTIFTQKEYQQTLQHLSSDKCIGKHKIIVSHSPPFQCLDLAKRFGLVFLGSKALREKIEQDPTIKLVVCGHVHLFGGKSLICNKTLVVNCASHDKRGTFGVVGVLDLDREEGVIQQQTWRFLAPPLQKLIWGIGFRYDTILNAAGYNRLEDLLEHDLMTIHYETEQKIGRKRLKNFRFHAHATKTGEQIIDKLSLKTSFETLYHGILIDIESDPKFQEIICIGVLFQNRYTSFFLEESMNTKLQKKMLENFIEFLKTIKQKHGKRRMYCYSGGDSDFSPIERALRHCKCPVSIFNFFPKTDILQELVQIAFLPIPNYKLTTVANYLGYKTISKLDYDGLILSSEYYINFSPQFKTSKHQKQEVKKKILMKNENDLRKMIFIWKNLFSR